MNRIKVIIGLLIVLIIIVVLITQIIKPAQALSTKDPDFAAIEHTLQSFSSIKASATDTLDDSRLSDVLANDPRGGLVDIHFLKVVQYIQGKPDLKLEDIGYLDIYQARFAFDRKLLQLYNAAVASGEFKIIPTPTDNAILPTPFDPLDKSISPEMRATDQARRTFVQAADPNSIPEIQALEKKVQFGVVPQPHPGYMTKPFGFSLLSITVEGDLAHARVDWDYGLADDILVNKNGSWYLVGEEIIQWHGG